MLFECDHLEMNRKGLRQCEQEKGGAMVRNAESFVVGLTFLYKHV